MGWIKKKCLRVGVEMNEILKELERLYTTNGTPSEKKQQLSRISNNPFVKWYFRNLIAPNETFGIKLLESNIDTSKLSEEVNTEQLMQLVPLLKERVVTGNAAKEKAISSILSMGGFWRLGLNLINKKTPPSLGKVHIASIYTDLLPSYSCGACRGRISTFEKDDGTWIAQKKYDGVRVLIYKKNGSVNVYSRNFNTLYTSNFSYIVNDLSNILNHYVVDGELDLGDRQKTASFSLSKKELEDSVKRSAKYFVFDLIPIDKWEQQKYEMPLRTRIALLDAMLGKDNQFAVLAQSRAVKDMNDANAYYKSIVGDGTMGEGIVLKKLESPYVFGDNPYWIKMKYEETVDGVVVGFEEGVGRLSGSLGALIVDLFSGKRVRVGGGFSDSQRREIWDKLELYLGRTVEFKANGKTKYGATNHAVFITFRYDK